MTDLLLLGDLGGTNCRLELVPSPVSGAAAGTGSGRPSAVHKARYRTADHPSLAAMLTKFVKETPWENFPKAGHETKGEHDVSRAPMLCCLSVCGPVTVDPESGAQQSVLLAPVFGAGGWTLNSKDLSTAVGCQVLMLNDFHSVGLALPLIPEEDVHTLYEGRPTLHGPLACLGPGTGLGQVYAVWNQNSGSYTVCPSEGGMSDFVARTDEEWALRQHISKTAEEGHVDVEMVVSGEGIANIYRWLRSTEPDAVNPIVDALVMAAPEPAAVISTHLDDVLCARAVQIFLTALGNEAGNMAVRYQATGGVYIAGGGIVSKLLPLVKDGRVAAAYKTKGHSFACYDSCPLYAATTSGDELGMLGAWKFASAYVAEPPASL